MILGLFEPSTTYLRDFQYKQKEKLPFSETPTHLQGRHHHQGNQAAALVDFWRLQLTKKWPK